MKFKSILGSLLVVAGLSLAACNEQGASSAPKAPQVSAEKERIQKHNAYVGIANSLTTPFARRQMDYLKQAQDKLESGKKITSYSVPGAFMVTRLQERLDKAIAMPGQMPDIDTPARGFAKALAQFEPLNNELSNYADSKEYLVDDGKKAREKDAAYRVALDDVVKAEDAFLAGIQKQDEINTRKAFEEAAKDSEDYYRAGIILYAKQTMRLAGEVFETNGSKAAITPFSESLAQTAEMVTGWEKKVRARNTNGCTSMMSSINDFLGMSRTVLQHAEEGNYTPKPDSMSWRLNNPIQYDANTLQLRFNSMIGAFNRPQC